MLMDDYEKESLSYDLTVERAIKLVAPLFVEQLIKRHPSAVLAIIAADIAIEAQKHFRSRRKFGELVLLKDFQ